MTPSGTRYVPGFVPGADDVLAAVLGSVDFSQRTVRNYGKVRAVPRLESWYGDRDYTFSGHTFKARPMPPVLLGLCFRLQSFLTNNDFVCDIGVMCNLYRDGADSVAYHDDADHGGAAPFIASVSLGATRTMRFRRKSKTAALASAVCPNSTALDLEHGSLFAMVPSVQDQWEHSIPKRKEAGLRVNLTFRGRGC